MNWQIVTAGVAVISLAGSLLNVWMQAQLRGAVLGMSLSIETLKLELYRQTKQEVELLRASISTLETKAATLQVQMAAFEKSAHQSSGYSKAA